MSRLDSLMFEAVFMVPIDNSFEENRQVVHLFIALSSLYAAYVAYHSSAC